jgi:hypothetical protein
MWLNCGHDNTLPAYPPETTENRVATRSNPGALAGRSVAGKDVALLIGMIAVLAVPACITLSTVRHEVGAVPPGANPTPYGYTISLSIFLVPVVAIGLWHLVAPRHPVDRKALFASTATVASLGAVLDLIFGHSFFTFHNPGATIGLRLPAWSFGEMAWIPRYLPVEEFLFYILGGLFMIVVYLWADNVWLQAYEPEHYRDEIRKRQRLVNLSTPMFLLCVGLIAAGWLFKKYGPHNNHAGIPGYFTFQVLLAFLPTVIFFRCVKDFINWHAFAFGWFILLLVSLLWEATLGVPYGWWAYRTEQMLGVHILAWRKLPLEAVLLWLVAAWGAVISYEFWRAFFHMARPAREALFGRLATGGEE